MLLPRGGLKARDEGGDGGENLLLPEGGVHPRSVEQPVGVEVLQPEHEGLVHHPFLSPASLLDSPFQDGGRGVKVDVEDLARGKDATQVVDGVGVRLQVGRGEVELAEDVEGGPRAPLGDDDSVRRGS